MSYYQNDSPGGYGGGYNGGGGGGGNRKRGRDFDDEGGSNAGYGGGYGGGRRQQRRFNDYDQPIAPYGGRDYSDMGGRGGYHRGGGGRRGRGGGARHYNNDRDHAFQALLSAGEKYSIDLWRLGDVIPDAKVDEASRFTSTSKEDLQGLADETKDLWAKGSKEDVLRAFRIAIAECPHKLPYFATILSLLANEAFTPPPARIPAKPLVTITNPAAVSSTGTATNGDDAEMQAAAAASAPTTSATPQSINIGLEIVKDLVKVFQNHLDARRWRSVRFGLHMFANLATLPKPLISISSLLSLLNQSFIFVLENEFSLRAERGDELVRVVLETLLRIPSEYLQGQNETLDAIRNGLGNYMGSRSLDLAFLGDKINESQWIDPLQQLYEAFTTSTGEALPTLPRPYEQFPNLANGGDSAPKSVEGTNGEAVEATESYNPEAFNLPVISLPIDTDEDTVPASAKLPGSARAVNAPATAPGESDDWAREPVGYSGVRAGLAFFVDETVPSRNTYEGLYLRQLMVDILNVYEVNRKDCARILLNDLPKWLPEGVFKPSAKPANAEPTSTDEMTTESRITVIKENTLMDVILSQMLSTPNSVQSSIYYYSLITELCKLSPSTVAPALGKCIRKLYAGLGLSDEEAGIDVIVLGPEGIRRYSDWMATHLSNFGFHWRWPEWQGDLSLPANHPKKVFIARVLDLETRLSYHERIKSTLPEEYLSSSAGVFPSEAPAPDFTYEAEGPSPYQSAASDVLSLMRSKATSGEIKELLEKLKADFVAGELGDEPIDEEAAERRARDILFQCILVVGSRSFSHYLNVLERYIVILRESTNSAAARSALLRSASRFWSSNTLFRHIVFDKLLQYRIIDPIDVVNFVFEGEELVLDGEITPRDWSDLSIWDLFKMTLEKVQNRVLAVTLRLENLRKREENRMDTERAAAGEMKTDENDDGTRAEGEGEAKITDEQAAIEVANVEKQVDAVKKEQESLFVDVVRRWQETLTAVEGGEDAWPAWFANGWFNEFCRAFAGDLTRQLDALAHVELPTEGAVYQGLAAAQRWVEFV